MSLQVATSLLEKRLRQFNQDLGAARTLAAQRDRLKLEIDQQSGEVQLLGKVLAVFHEASTALHQQYISSVEELVTSGIQSVFGPGYQFVIEPTIRGNNVNLDFAVTTPDGKTSDLLDSHGGGLVSLCGIILRVIVCRLLAPKTAQILVLDEPLSHLSSEYADEAAQLLRHLAQNLGLQLVLVTHDPVYATYADKSYELKPSSAGVVARERQDDELPA